MKNLAMILTAFAVFAMLAACGGGDYQAPPKANERQVDQGGGGGTGGPKSTGPSMTKEYRTEMEAAFAAHDDYEAVKDDKEARKEPYLKWAEHLYAALAYANIHARNGHSKDNLPRFQELKELRSGYFKYALGPSDDPRVKAAMKKWQESTS